MKEHLDRYLSHNYLEVLKYTRHFLDVLNIPTSIDADAVINNAYLHCAGLNAQDMTEDKVLTKRNLIQLQHVKNRVTGQRDKECFCASVRRKVWLKDFTQWYEGALG